MMIRQLLALALGVLTASPALAAPCKDARGKFTKCPTTPAKPTKCKNAKGQFAKCGTPDAKPV